jgi:DNA-binding NarL/FixJ family response regulator
MHMALDTAQRVTAGWTDAPRFRSREPVSHPHGMELAAPDVLRGWIVLVHDSSDSEVVMLRAWIASLGGTAIRLPQVADAMPYLARNPDARIALVLEARADDLEDRIDACLAIRARFPACPIILLSETFGKNDFSTERMAVCDASLRSPVTQVAFKLAVPAALSNNAFFRMRGVRTSLPAAAPVAETEAAPRRPRPAMRRGLLGDVCLSCGVGLLLSLGLVAMFTS